MRQSTRIPHVILAITLGLSAIAVTASPASALGHQPADDVVVPGADVTQPEQPAVAPEQPTASSLVDPLLKSRLDDVRLGRDVAYLVLDEATGVVLSENLADKPMQAASNMKIVTATNALATMGPDRRFPTRVLSGATSRDVILQGGGDPLLSRRNLDQLAFRTAEGLRRGAHVVVHVDGDLFPKPSPGPGWVDAYLGSSVGFTQALGLRGDRSRHPALSAAGVFAGRLRDLGIHARLGANRDPAADAAVLAELPGHTVASALAVMLRESDSGIAEVIFRQVALATGRPPTWAGSQEAAVATLGEIGIDSTGMVLMDGSGLSRDDRLTARFLSQLLRVVHVTQAPRFSAMFANDALPTAGQTGTLTPAYGRYASSPSRCATGKVQAKTGTILSTIALSGIAHTADSGTRIFSIIVNHRPLRYSALSTRQAVDGLAATVTGCWT